MRKFLDNYATISVPILGSLFMAECVWVGKQIERRRDPARYRFGEPPGIMGGLIYTGLMILIPVVIVIWGFATGRLPAN